MSTSTEDGVGGVSTYRSELELCFNYEFKERN